MDKIDLETTEPTVLDEPEAPVLPAPPRVETTNDGIILKEHSGSQLETFADANLDPRLLEAIAKNGWQRPTPVQSLCLPASLGGRDLAGFAQTGTGKTGVFLITVANGLLTNPAPAAAKDGQAHPAVLVLAPTRELAMQITSDAEGILGALGFKTVAVFGGMDYEKQMRELREGVDVVVATPGRLIDFFQKHVISLDRTRYFVCDEVDRMFDMGFIDDVEKVLDRLPEETQKLIFSATTNPEVKELAFEYLNNPEYISVNPQIITSETIEQHAVICEARNKLQVILGLLREHQPECAIVFTNTKLTAEWLHFKLVHNGIEADLITGDLPQRKRVALIQKIKEGRIKALIATDVASRGLHISRVSHVYNFDIPDDPASYVHRIGRTARAGAKGSAFSLVCEDYGHNLAAINELLGTTLALRSEWFDERFLQIKDEAGNPFAEGRLAEREARASAAERGDGHERSEGRGRRGRESHRERSGAERGPQEGRGARHGGPRGEGEARRREGGQQRPAGARGDQGDHRNRRPRGAEGQHEQRAEGRGERSQRPQDHRRHQQGRQQERQGHVPRHPDRKGQPSRFQQPPKQTAAPQATAPQAASSSSVGGILKKIVNVLFGRSKKS